MTTVVLAGATGFVGSAVLRALGTPRGLGRAPVRVRAVCRAEPAGSRRVPGVEYVRADLAAPATLRGLCRGADVLVNAASYVGGDAARCVAVNERGTGALVAEARAAGVRRIVQVSTTAVYGPGPHHGPDVGELTPAPVSAASRARLAAERPVRDAAGLVLRAPLVLGAGDRWVVPALAELVRRVPGRWDGGRGLLSLVAVDDLGRLVAAAATADAVPAGVYHAAHPEPVRCGDLLAALVERRILPPPGGADGAEHLPWDACLRRLRASRGRVSERQFALLARDHHYRSDAVWETLGCPPGPGPLARLDNAAPWYRAAWPGYDPRVSPRCPGERRSASRPAA
ncbi:NAD(P)-dependent oxidoreductase [Streptomyces sp. B6B3]|uniref:NAD-dependent epimerase/dehydratase family protein n=1 Tax=Streptomyces sp. B6B3 TaxID=3153570 RepID=UPI00325C48DA